MNTHIKVICSTLVLFFSAILQSAHAGYNAQSCRTPYADHGVYDATIVYMIDEVIDGPLLLPMDTDRNTYKYRKTAYKYFLDQFGLQFDASNAGVQIITDSQGGQANVFPVKTGAGSTHQVYAVDAQKKSAWRSKMPLTNVAFFDDGYFVTLETDFIVNGKFGGASGLTLSAGTQLVFGEYRMFDHRGRLLETFEYRSDIPVAGIPVTGNFQASDGALFLTIACEIKSKLFGEGNVRALAEIRPLEDGKTYLDFRYVMKFPAQLSDVKRRYSRCDRLYPLRGRGW